VPFKWYPKTELLAQAAAWRMVDLSETNGDPIDLVIATKFPTYFVRHPRKVTWLFHQYRAIYDLLWHRVQRVRPFGGRRSPARHADPARRRSAEGIVAALHHRPEPFRAARPL